MFGFGNQELLIFLGIVLVIFGPKQLPKLAKAMGGALKDFKRGMHDVESDFEDAMDDPSPPKEAEAHLEGDEPDHPAEAIRSPAEDQSK